jgi:hypothetical protein
MKCIGFCQKRGAASPLKAIWVLLACVMLIQGLVWHQVAISALAHNHPVQPDSLVLKVVKQDQSEHKHDRIGFHSHERTHLTLEPQWINPQSQALNEQFEVLKLAVIGLPLLMPAEQSNLVGRYGSEAPAQQAQVHYQSIHLAPPEEPPKRRLS